jgi:hypothetical protein
MPIVVLSVFPSDVDSLEHPRVVDLRRMIESGCAAYNCEMTSFAIKNGVVLVGLTSDEFAKEMMDVLTQSAGIPAEIVENQEEFWRKAKEIIEERTEGTTDGLGT